MTEKEQSALIAKLEAERALMAAIFDQAPHPIDVYRPSDGTRWLRNRRAIALEPRPHTQDGFVDEDPSQVTRADRAPIEVRDYPISRAFRGETVFGEEFFLKLDGRLRRYVTNAAPIYDSEGKLLAAVLTWDDVTQSREIEAERERLVAELDESRRLFTSIADATPNILVLFNPFERKFIYYNNQAMLLLGYTSSEFLEVVAADQFVHPDDRELRNSVLTRLLTLPDGEVIEFEYRLRHKDGSYRWFLFRNVIFSRDPDGRPKICLVVAQDINERKQIHEELQLRIAERTAQLMRAEEEVRVRIARELHDEMGQHVSALKIGLQSLREGVPDTRRIDQLAAVVQDLDDHIDRLAHELRPLELHDFGLTATLASHVAQFSERSGIPVDFHNSGVEGERFSALIETTLYRVVQEALTNILKHAHAGTVSVILERHKGQVQLIVEDDGVGFNAEDAGARRLGVPGMRERVALAGGTFNIESSIGGGTSIFVRLPSG